MDVCGFRLHAGACKNTLLKVVAHVEASAVRARIVVVALFVRPVERANSIARAIIVIVALLGCGSSMDCVKEENEKEDDQEKGAVHS